MDTAEPLKYMIDSQTRMKSKIYYISQFAIKYSKGYLKTILRDFSATQKNFYRELKLMPKIPMTSFTTKAFLLRVSL